MAALGAAAADLCPRDRAGAVGRLVTTGVHSAANPPAVVVARAGGRCPWISAGGF